MPLYHMKEIWTPLKLINIKFFKSDKAGGYIKIGKNPRKRIAFFKGQLG
ncbi:hypothetical protein ACFOU2_14745 [Bacillus songklensis]|uniref:Uncharacterized protein n=1 Tax=Bacillus songklensis TaxID=1069116 RepID=A0ABV8B689_9BACI